MLQSFWDAVSVILISIFLMGGIFGGPIFFMLKFTKTKRIKRFPFREPNLYTNAHGHLVLVRTTGGKHPSIIKHLNNNPKQAKEMLDLVLNTEKEDEAW